MPSRALSALLGKTRRESSHFPAQSAQAVLLPPFACLLSGRLGFQSELFVAAFHEATRTPAAGPSPIRYRGPSQALARTLGFPQECASCSTLQQSANSHMTRSTFSPLLTEHHLRCGAGHLHAACEGPEPPRRTREESRSGRSAVLRVGRFVLKETWS